MNTTYRMSEQRAVARDSSTVKGPHEQSRAYAKVNTSSLLQSVADPTIPAQGA